MDIIHVTEYLWKAAFVFYFQTSTQAEAWESKRLQLILEGKSSSVAPGMPRSATLPKLTPQEGKPVDTCARYLLRLLLKNKLPAKAVESRYPIWATVDFAVI